MILNLKDKKNSTRKLLHTINSFSKVVGYKINLEKSVAFLYNKEQIEKEYRKTIPFSIASKNHIPRNNLNKRCKCPLQGKLQTIEGRNLRSLQKVEILLMDWQNQYSKIVYTT
jgi:hypothetical protein